MSERSIEDGDFSFAQADTKGRVVDSLRISDGVHADDDGLSVSDSASGHSSQHSDERPTGGAKPDYDELADATRDAEMATSSGAQPGAAADASGPLFPGGYDPAKYAGLAIDPAVKELFKYIGRYKPERRDLPTELKPFIPDYMPAVGDVDEFLKPPRPDGAFEPLGLTVLDEPSVKQSDPAIMRKFLRAHLAGTAAVQDEDGGAPIAHADEDRARKIEQWVADVDALHDKEVAGEFKPKGRFPPYDTLLQTWPEELEPLVRSLRRPDGAVEADTEVLARTVCGLLDVPVYGDLVDTLHHVFMLYLELKNNPMINPPAADMGLSEQLNYVSLA